MNQKLINDLREGRIVLHYDNGDLQMLRNILTEAFPDDKWETVGEDIYYYRDYMGVWGCEKSIPGKYIEKPIIPIADFLRPEPRFKIGDRVCHVNNSNISGRVTGLIHNGERWVYSVPPFPGVFKEEKIWFASPDETTESATKTGTEQQFEPGKSYSFTDRDGIEWQGELLSVIDHKYKYIALINGSDIPAAFDQIKTIQPRKITRYINVCPDGRVLRKSYETEQEARDKACQGGMTDCKQVRLEGVI